MIAIEAGYYLSDLLADVRELFAEPGKTFKVVHLANFAHHLVPLVSFPAYHVWRKAKVESLLDVDTTDTNVQPNIGFVDFITGLLLVT